MSSFTSDRVEPRSLAPGGPPLGREAVHDPADVSQQVGSAPRLGRSHVDAAVAAAERAQVRWRDVPAVERARLVGLGVREAVGVDGLAELLTLEQGKPLAEARMEVGSSTTVAENLAAQAALLDEGDLRRDDDAGRLHVFYEPVGVVAIITPFNWPLALSMNRSIAALIAGNGIVVKPARTAPLAVLRAFEHLRAHLPDGLVSVVVGEDADVAVPLVAHPRVRMVSFTGSIPSGRKVAAAAAATVKNLSLELGGNDAALLLDDVVVDDALCARLVAAAFTTSGQVCFGLKRVYAPERLVPRLVEGVLSTLDSAVVGAGIDPATTIGPLHTEAQRDLVRGLVDDAAARGARVEVGGRVATDLDRGWFLRPVVVSGVDGGAPLVVEEQFGPALPIVGYDRPEAALDQINRSEFGLGSSIWSADEDRAFALARRVEAGSTFVNDHGLAALDRDGPFGGVKQSGVGREQGTEGLLSYTEPHTVSLRRSAG